MARPTGKPRSKPAAKAEAPSAKPAKSVKPARPAKPAGRRTVAAAPQAPAGDGWLPADGGYAVTLREGRLVCRNPAGKELASVPPKAAASPAAEQLEALADWLEEHRRDCLAAADAWMLRSLPVPAAVVTAVWQDPAWRAALENTVVRPADALGAPDRRQAGFLRGAEAGRGIGIVTLDGDTRWLAAAAMVLPHPVLLGERDDWRQLAAELGLRQGVQQLLREVHERTADRPGDTAVTRFANAEFEMLAHVCGRCRQLGYPVRGGYATCTVLEGTGEVRASYWIGAEDPQSPTTTGELTWSGADDRPLTLGEVGPIAYSEGMRMAAALYAKRKVAEQES
ncbi:MAG: DUF4132 domain-containing protein [Planctomycetes bacterium]|nr:DUF4132 domain-containing protein [Planctomycetota bacterium]